MTKKPCPFCGKPTTTVSTNCRRCGAQLQEYLPASDPLGAARPSPRLPLERTVKVAFYCLIVVTGAICALAAVRSDRAPSSNYAAHSRTDPWTAYRTTATDLYQHYSAYEAAAELTTSAIEISGTVKSVGQGLFDETEVVLDAGADSKSVTVTLEHHAQQDVSALSSGVNVSVFCENMTRILGPPTGQSCRLLR